MFKVVFTVIKVDEPKSVNGSSTHVSGPCKMYKIGDKITITGNTGRLCARATK
jgi:hypothetical protein